MQPKKINSGEEYPIEYKIIVDGKLKWISEKSSPIFDEQGKLTSHSGICSDITQRKSYEALLKKKNRAFMDSILYARTIQESILVTKQEISEKLKEFFIYSYAKEIVSGDFYFYRETSLGIVIAVADFNGHSVPAGFMSMLGNAFLNEIIASNENLNPSQILDQLREKTN